MRSWRSAPCPQNADSPARLRHRLPLLQKPRLKLRWRRLLPLNHKPPLITVLGLQIAGTFTGAIITEGIFSWPGMGTMINTAINNRDYSLIQGAVLFSAIMFVFCNMLVDIAYAILNPKVKLEKG